MDGCSVSTIIAVTLYINSTAKEVKSVFQEALNFIDNAVVITDSNLTVEYINDSYQNMFFLQREEVIGRKISDVFPDLKRSQRVIHLAVEEGESKNFQNVPLYWKGKDYILNVDTHFLYHENGSIHKVITKIEDRTEEVMKLREMAEVINNMTINIIRIDAETGILPLQPIIYDSQYDEVIKATTAQSVDLGLEVLIIDLSAIREVDDRFLTIISNLFQGLTLLGVRVLFSGVHPSLARGLQPFRQELKSYPSYGNLHAALQSI